MHHVSSARVVDHTELKLPCLSGKESMPKPSDYLKPVRT
eukprot:SAG31_NODE_29437_length_395_cov_1.016892_2_plen_38_part_01